MKQRENFCGRTARSGRPTKNATRKSTILIISPQTKPINLCLYDSPKMAVFISTRNYEVMAKQTETVIDLLVRAMKLLDLQDEGVTLLSLLPSEAGQKGLIIKAPVLPLT